MTFSGRTYLFSFTGFVLIFLGLGIYFGSMKIRDHFQAKAFLDAVPLQTRLVEVGGGRGLRWDAVLPAGGNLSARVQGGGPEQPVTIRYSDDPGPWDAPGWVLLPVAAHERVEDLRLDPDRGRLFIRLRGRSAGTPALETTWICTFDLARRRMVRKASMSPAMLPPPYLP